MTSISQLVRYGGRFLVASRQRSISVAPRLSSVIHQIPSGNVQPSFTRLLSTSHARLDDTNTNEPVVPEIPILPIEIIERSIRDQVVLIDVRKPEEIALGKIPTANCLPDYEIESAMKLSAEEFKLTYHFEKPLQSSLVVLYCRSGKRAGRAGEMLRDKFGYKNVLNYKGSWNDWSDKHPEDVKPAAESA